MKFRSNPHSGRTVFSFGGKSSMKPLETDNADSYIISEIGANVHYTSKSGTEC